MQRLLLCVILTTMYFTAYSQKAVVEGVIKDIETGETLIGVNITVAGQTVGTVTDLDGNYKLELDHGTTELLITYIGYREQKKYFDLQPGQTVRWDVDLEVEIQMMDQVVVSGSRFEKKLAEETVSMTVITPDQLANVNTVTIEESLGRIPGVDEVDGQVSMRGGAGYSYGAGSRVLILQDDMPIVQADAGRPLWSSIPLENLGQVEVIKGAASALYGSSALNGIINLRTADPVSKPYFHLSMFGTLVQNPRDNIDSNDIAKSWWTDDSTAFQPYSEGFGFGYRQKFGDFDVVLGGYRYQEQSWRKEEWDNRARVNGSFRWRATDKLITGIGINYQRGRNQNFFIWNGNGSQLYRPWEALGGNTITVATRFVVDPFFIFNDGKGNRHKLQVRYNKIDNDNTNNQGNFSDSYYGEYQYQHQSERIDLVTTAGIVGNYVSVDADLYGDTTLTGRNVAAFLQLDKKFFQKLSLSVGARFESNEISDTEPEEKVVFRIGTNYQAAAYTYIRGSFGQGYRFPTIAEKFIETNIGFLSIAQNLDLVSETGWSGELGIKQGIRLGTFNALVDLSLFYTEYTDMIEIVFTDKVGIPGIGGFQFQNIGDTKISGLEFGLGGEGKLFGLPTRALIGYTYTNPKFKNFADSIAELSSCSDNVLKYRFENTVKGEIESDMGSFNLGTNIQYYSYMKCVDQVFEALLPGVEDFRSAHNTGTFIWDAHIAYNLNGHYKLTFLVRNLLNSEYSMRPAIIESPRNYTLRFDYTL